MALIPDPSTGAFVDPATGHVYLDAGGTQLSTDPGLNSQAQRSLSISNQLYSKLGGFQQGYQSASNGQTGLTQQLDRTINGTAPSVAGTQLVQAQDQIAKQQLSEAAGATGTNAALARYAAMQNTANSQAQANQSAAILRAQEVAQAEQVKGQVLGQQASEADTNYGNTVTGTNQASSVAGATGTAQADVDQKDRTADKTLVGNLVSGAGNAITTAATKSDPKEKKEIAKTDDADLAKLADHMKSFTFDYKNPGTEGEMPGHRIGTMAPEIEKGGPIGKAIVIKGKTLSLDNNNSIGALMSLVGYLKKEIDTLKSKGK